MNLPPLPTAEQIMEATGCEHPIAEQCAAAAQAAYTTTPSGPLDLDSVEYERAARRQGAAQLAALAAARGPAPAPLLDDVFTSERDWMI